MARCDSLRQAPKAAQPMFWCYELGEGRVFGCVPGHSAKTFDNPMFRRLLFRGIAWTARENPLPFDEVFSKKAWVAFDTLVWPRGAGQQVRGVLFKNDRPGLIIIDDLEDPKYIENKDYRDNLYEWLYADVIKAVPRIGPQAKTYKIVYIDTLKHEDSVLQRLLESPE